MKLRSSFLLLFATVLAFAQKIDVMTFNIRLSTDSDKENAWNFRKQDVLDLIYYYHPDVLGVQEALPVQMEALQNGLSGYAHIGVGRDDGKDKGEFAAIFYDKNKLAVLQSGTFWLSETPEKPSKGWDAALNRICTYALFKTKKEGKMFWAFNLHFDHIGNVARINSSKLILQKIKELDTQNVPVVLTGDFNLTDDSEPINIISQSMNDTFYHSQKPHYGPKATFQNFDVTKPATERIDYIFVKGFTAVSNRTINDRRENLRYFSDHFPVLAELKFNKK